MQERKIVDEVIFQMSELGKKDGKEGKESKPKVTENKPFYKSKKWWTAIIAGIVPVVNTYSGLELSAAEVTAVVVPLVTYVIAEGIVDATH